MFKGVSSFNQSLNNWNVYNVTNMHCMFDDTSIIRIPYRYIQYDDDYRKIFKI